MSDPIISSVEMSPAFPTVLPTPPATGAAHATAAVSSGAPTNGAANDTPKPGSRKAKRLAREAQKKAKDEARAKAKQARQDAEQAQKLAEQKAREERKAQAEARRMSRKKEKSVRPDSSAEVWRATFLAAAAQARGVDDPCVTRALQAAAQAFSTFEKDVVEQPATASKLANLKAADQNLYAVFTEDLGIVVHGLLTARGGSEFVNSIRASDKVTMAKQLIGSVTPRHLGHNGHLLEAMKSSLAEYQQAHQAYGDLKRESDQASTRIADGKRLVQLAVSLLQSAPATAVAHQALADERKAQAERHRQEAQADKTDQAA